MALEETHARISALLVKHAEQDSRILEAEAGRKAAERQARWSLHDNEAILRLKESQELSLRSMTSSLVASNQCEAELFSVVDEAAREVVERGEREDAASKVISRYKSDQRSIWVRSPECVLAVLVLTAQNGFSGHGFKNLSWAYRWDEQLWDALKDRRGPNGWTHLMVAAQEGDVERVTWLLKRSADVSAASTDNGNTPLLLAVEFRHLEVARLLLDRGANVNAVALDGYSSLLCASLDGSVDMGRVLLDRGADLYAKDAEGDTSLILASNDNHVEFARLLLDRGANVNDARAIDGMTPLLIASDNSSMELFLLFLQRGANVNAASSNNFTALHWASQWGHVDIARMLLKRGADVNTARNGLTAPINLAWDNDHLLIFFLLLDKGAQVNIRRTTDGMTPLIWACESGLEKQCACF